MQSLKHIQFQVRKDLSQTFNLHELQANASRVYIFRPETSIPDARVDEYIKPYEKSWFSPTHLLRLYCGLPAKNGMNVGVIFMPCSIFF